MWAIISTIKIQKPEMSLAEIAWSSCSLCDFVSHIIVKEFWPIRNNYFTSFRFVHLHMCSSLKVQSQHFNWVDTWTLTRPFKDLTFASTILWYTETQQLQDAQVLLLQTSPNSHPPLCLTVKWCCFCWNAFFGFH